jgi:hypothetical protein
MAASIHMTFGACCLLLLGASLGPDSLGYWIRFGYDRRSLGLDMQLMGFLATIVLIALKSAEMGNRHMVVAGTLACLTLAAFICVGFTLPPVDARAVCLLLNGFQGVVFCLLMVHRQMRTMSRF